GPSGAGKSTLLHALAGLTGPESAITGEEEGELSVDGAPAERGRGGTGLVAQDPETQLVMARAGDDVAFGLENIGTDPELIGGRVAGDAPPAAAARRAHRQPRPAGRRAGPRGADPAGRGELGDHGDRRAPGGRGGRPGGPGGGGRTRRRRGRRRPARRGVRPA